MFFSDLLSVVREDYSRIPVIRNANENERKSPIKFLFLYSAQIIGWAHPGDRFYRAQEKCVNGFSLNNSESLG